jgi:hypothetical protein
MGDTDARDLRDGVVSPRPQKLSQPNAHHGLGALFRLGAPEPGHFFFGSLALAGQKEAPTAWVDYPPYPLRPGRRLLGVKRR